MAHYSNDPCVEGHTAFIYDRGGKRRVAELLDMSMIRWERDRDRMSEATVRIQGSACSAQAGTLSNIEPRRSELVIFRGEDRVWEGPVNRVGWHSGHVEINAHDIFEYILNTPLSQEYDNGYPNNTLVTTRIGHILDEELPVWEVLDPPANILPHVTIHHFPNEAGSSHVTQPYEMTVGEHIQQLARYSGIDFVAVGRALHVWDVSRSLGRTRTLTEADFTSEVIVTAYGSDFAAEVYVRGEDGALGHAGSPSSYYGPWVKILTTYNQEGTAPPTEADLNSQAQRNLAGRNPVPIEVRVPDNSGIRLSDSLRIEHLVPGVQMPLLATLNSRQMSQVQKLDRLVVTETGTDAEKVAVTLSPATKPDEDEED